MISDAIRNKNRAVIPYITAGLPDLETTGEIIRALSDAGAAAIEIGLPFSDPMADGPVLQKASHMALQAGFTMEGLMENLEGWTSSTDIPLIIMSYINPIMRGGMKETLESFRGEGVQGVIIPDLPADARDLFNLCRGIGIDLIRLVAPTTTVSRKKEVISGCRGFVYAVSVKGVTGARTALPEEVSSQVKAIKAMTDLPVCVGFGVSTARQVDDMLAFADGVIVGSHIMAVIMDAPDPVKAAYDCFRELGME
ncbi:MAG TPA: tryptophan synthase subunit alpha [Deltaproteobacteria bacterium]|nr:tryptophan synthase subunit alpha [Deltaproteobacteria bacterium]